MKPYLLALTLMIGFSVSSCAAEKNVAVIRFNDTLVSYLKTSQEPFDEYWATVAPWYNAKKIDMEPVHLVFARIEQTHRELYAKLLEIEVPEGKLCEDFYDAVMQYFEVDREVIAALKSGTTYISEHNPAVGQEDLDRVNQMVDPILERRTAIFEQVESTQNRLAEEYDLALK